MNQPLRNRRTDYFLDVSDYILSDPRQAIPSPGLTPVQHQQSEGTANLLDVEGAHCLVIQHGTPHNLPLVIEVGGVELSPYFQVGGPKLDIEFYDFTLEYSQNGSEEEEEGLEEINEQSSNQESSNQEKEQMKDEEGEGDNVYEAYNSTLNISYFEEAIEELRKMGATKQELREFVMDYLTEEDCEDGNMEEATIEQLKETARHNLRPVGPISWLERRMKVQKYISKKNKRTWKKKISYDCRKRVADNRLRVKGKFVTKQQACNMLGVDQLEEEELKQLLEIKTSKSTS